MPNQTPPHELDTDQVERIVRDAVFLALAGEGAPELSGPSSYKLADAIAALSAEGLAGLTVSAGGCLVHCGAVHGGEAEELRAGIEALIADPPGGDLESNREWKVPLQALLDRVNASDSLARLERRNDDVDTLRWMRQQHELYIESAGYEKRSASNTVRAGKAVALCDRLLALLPPPAIDGIDQGANAPAAVLRETSDPARPGLIGDETLDIAPTERGR